jgi:flagellar biogenesis protein FliO
LGGRHALHVVGYEDQRLLIGSSPGGLTLLTHLPASEPEPAKAPVEEASEQVNFKAGFAAALQRVLLRKPS